MCLCLNEAKVCSIVEEGGGRYVGFLKNFIEQTEFIVLFISPQTRSTLGVPISQLTVEAVREHLAESNATFAPSESGEADENLSEPD